MWDMMWRATINYGRKGLPIQALSAVDLALWDLLGKLRNEPVYVAASKQPSLCAPDRFVAGMRCSEEKYATGSPVTAPLATRATLRNWDLSVASTLVRMALKTAMKVQQARYRSPTELASCV